MPEGRVAIYYAPDEESGLAKFGNAWLGCAGHGAPADSPWTTADWATIVQSPRHYGFHATLKPPFALRDGYSPGDVVRAAELFAEGQRPFPLPALRLSTLGSFLALTEASPSLALSALAAACVREFERFRRPPPPEELAARRQGISNRRQLELIEQWGYPYVFDEWKFHLTLTSSVPAADTRAKVETYLRQRLTPLLSPPLVVDSVCIFSQSRREEPFQLLARKRFGGPKRVPA